ncbi:hypothetical protein [Lysobacter gummosus]|uniref:Uncharacterized protein n=1 Tax=Lysobacter gummosus TaxID=262324 RepID=A0ABY3XBE4_9GAMM|nr:hypothetical protein [Lysobacter gummosus]ALN89240.1 hypothetical protein LG3211_0250 [Lysobacter gummosus]UNP29924.1 hypothetical protein MOV92_01155 [Lysobacter gummosus]
MIIKRFAVVRAIHSAPIQHFLQSPVQPAIQAPRVEAMATNVASHPRARTPSADNNRKLIARWRRNSVSGRLECRWLGSPVANGDDEPPPAARTRAVFARAAVCAGRIGGAVPLSRIEIRHEVRTPSTFAVPAPGRARARPGVAQCL